MRAPSPRSHTARLRLAALGLGLGLGLLAAELIARRMAPPPRVNAVKPGAELRLSERDGALYWTHDDPVRQGLGCLEQHPERPRIALYGSSILYGSGLSAEESPPAQLQTRLPGWCVLGHAEPGYGFEAKRAAAAATLDTLRPRIVLWEIWINDGARYHRAWDMAFDWGDLVRDATGTPSWLPLPGWLNQALFHHSRAYAWLTIARAPGGYAEGQHIWDMLSGGALDDLKAAVERAGGTLVLSLWPRLDRPFSRSAAAPPDGYRAVSAWAAGAGVALIDVAELLTDRDHTALRLDPCCHYNALGAAILGERLAPEILSAGPAARPRPPAR